MNIGFEYIDYRWKALQSKAISAEFSRELRLLSAKGEHLDELVKQNEFFQQYLQNRRKIVIQDFGAGSKKMGPEREIGQIARYNSTQSKYSMYLRLLPTLFDKKNILEMGSSLGFGTLSLALGDTDRKITTIEGCPVIAAEAQNLFLQFQLKNIELINLPFGEALGQKFNEKFDFVFVDGHHNGAFVLKYIQQLKSITTKDCVFLLDDIRWDPGMLSVWKKLKSDFSFSVDFFRMGILQNHSSFGHKHLTISR